MIYNTEEIVPVLPIGKVIIPSKIISERMISKRDSLVITNPKFMMPLNDVLSVYSGLKLNLESFKSANPVIFIL